MSDDALESGRELAVRISRLVYEHGWKPKDGEKPAVQLGRWAFEKRIHNLRGEPVDPKGDLILALVDVAQSLAHALADDSPGRAAQVFDRLALEAAIDAAGDTVMQPGDAED